MLKKLKWSWALTIISLIAGLVAYNQILPTVEIPIHWNIHGEVDNTARPHIALFLIPAFQILILTVFSAINFIEPRKQNIEKSLPAICLILTSLILVMTLVQAIIISEAFGFHIIGLKLILISVGFLFFIVGNNMTKLRSTFFFGIRTPWTLSSDYVWKKTHRLSGRLLMIEGFIISMAPIFFKEESLFIIIIATLLPATITPIIYSWYLWRKENKKNGTEYS